MMTNKRSNKDKIDKKRLHIYTLRAGCNIGRILFFFFLHSLVLLGEILSF